MPLVVADTLQVAINGVTADGPFVNVLHVAKDGTLSEYEQATAVLDSYETNLMPVLCNSIVVDRAYFLDLSSGSGVSGVTFGTGGTGVVGGVGVQALPPQNAYLVKLGGLSTRGTRNGRMYLPGVRSDEVDDRGDISSTTQGVVTAAVADFLSDVLANANQPLVIVHNPAGGPTSTTEVLGGFCEVAVATQRRRLKR